MNILLHPFMVSGMQKIIMPVVTAFSFWKISDYHPDKVANAAPELKELAELRAREINAAFDELQKLRKQP